MGSTDGYLYALDAWSGKLVWKFKTSAPIESSPAIANGQLFTGGDDGYVYCLNAYTGRFSGRLLLTATCPLRLET